MSILDLQIDQQPPEIQKIILRFKEVKQNLLEKRPQLPEALIDIHKGLQENEAFVHNFTDDDIAILHQSYESFKQFKLVEKAEKTVKKSSKKLSNDDLSNL